MAKKSNPRKIPEELTTLVESSKRIIREIRDAEESPEPDCDTLIINLRANIGLISREVSRNPIERRHILSELQDYARKKLEPQVYQEIYSH